MTMSSVYFYKYNGGKIQARGNPFPLVIFLLIFVFLCTNTGSPTCFDEGSNARNDRGRYSIFVEAFSLVPTSFLTTSRSSFLLLVQRSEEMIIDDDNSFANDTTVHYSDVINILAEANMDAESKRLFVESLKAKVLDASKDVGQTRESNPIAAPTKGKREGHGDASAKTTAGNNGVKTKGCQIPTIEGSWKDDGEPFHATGAWQTTPLLMKGAFVDDIDNLGSYPFPSWEEIIEIACDGGIDNDDHNIHDEVIYKEDFSDNQDIEGEYDEAVYEEGFSDNDDNESEYDDDDDDFEDGVDDFYLWDDGSDYDEDGEHSDNPPSRLIQHSWPRLDDSNYYHSDVNTNWLDTFEIKQFGPFNDPDSLEALLRTEDNDSTEKDLARTLLVNDVDRWFPKLSDWMDRRFNSHKNSEGGVLPARWRRDDAQISLSYPKGGIGPHVDDYDVFLIQLEGERTWDVLWEENSFDEKDHGPAATGNYASKISVRDETDCMLPESSTNGVRILNITKLQSLQEHRCGTAGTRLTRLHLRPGDCLYLPPRVLHCGTAVASSENCMTLSVGCRAPSALELLDGLSDLMKKSATTGTPQTIDSPGLTFPSSASLQAFHRRYTNAKISPNECNSKNDTQHSNDEVDDTWDVSSPPLQSSWLSPQVKDEMKTLVLKAVETALDDDANILDPLVGRFVTKSNRLEEEQFDPDGGDGSSYSYPKALRSFEGHNEDEENDMDEWANTTNVLMSVFGKPKTKEENNEFVLRRAEGISFAWSSVYDKDQQIRRYRLYAQGRPPFEVLDIVEEETDCSTKQLDLAPNSAIGRLMDRIANGSPLNRAFVVDELQILIDFNQKDSESTTSRLLYDLVEEGLLYEGPRIL